MDITIHPGKLSGTISPNPSKSEAHRLLICAALADGPTEIICQETNQDIDATVRCLAALGAKIHPTEFGVHVTPISIPSANALLNCGESGSTLRFLLPLVGAMGISATFQMSGRLPNRPLSTLWEELERMRCSLRFIAPNQLHCGGKLISGHYRIRGDVSSQFISGLLFALPLLDGNSTLEILGTLESRPYVDMTLDALDKFSVETDGSGIPGRQVFRSPGQVTVGGDWSNGAFWHSATALGNPICVTGLDQNSTQGDRIITDILPALNQHYTISAAHIPDLIPVLSVFAAMNQGAVFTDIRRLRLKESDRVAAIVDMITALGGKATATENSLHIHGTGLIGGIIDSHKDHRIAMATAIASTVCTQAVTILDAECVDKSYPTFWKEFTRLGGKYELYLR